MPDIEIKLLRIDEIRPNPFQPRESFNKEDIRQLADSLKSIGLLQPITVRKEGETYQIISGERRWRAAQFAGMEEIPSIVRDINDADLMMQSLIENVQRKDLDPMEKARGLTEVYRLEGLSPSTVGGKLKTIQNKIKGWGTYKKGTILNDEEKHVERIADKIGLSHDYQYQLLSLLRFTSEEQRRVSELKLGYDKASSIATIETQDVRQKVIELAPELKEEEVTKLSKMVKIAPEQVVQALLERKINPNVAELITQIEKPEIMDEALRKATVGVYTADGMKTVIERLERPPMELPEQPIDIQLHRKTMWNLQRIGGYDFYTIGLAKRSIEQFLELLKVKSVRTVVDVRKNPRSMFKVEFNKEKLSKALKGIEIEYIHCPELGVPEETRKILAETGDYEGFFKSYDDNILPGLKDINLKGLVYPIAMMCMELDPTACHRHRIALALEKQGLKGYDL